MKKRTLALLCCTLGLSFSGVATASAFLIKDAVQKSTTDTVDSVMYLKWGAESNFDAVTGLSDLTPVYRKIVLEKPVISGTNEKAEFRCTLNGVASKTMNGLSVDIATTDWETVPTTAAVKTLTTANEFYNVEVGTTEPTTVFYLKISITSAAYAGYASNLDAFGATLRLSYSQVRSN